MGSTKKTTAKRTRTERILEAVNQYGYFDKTIARKTFKKEVQNLSDVELNGTVMRAARVLRERGTLTSSRRGRFELNTPQSSSSTRRSRRS